MLSTINNNCINSFAIYLIDFISASIPLIIAFDSSLIVGVVTWV